MKNLCFDYATLVLYKETEDGVASVAPIQNLYQKYADKDIYVFCHTFDEVDHTSVGTWKKARLCETTAIQQICIYIEPHEIGGCGLESENVIRVTPNHVFPVLTKDGYKDVDAYLLETGDKLISERMRKFDGDLSDVPVDENENVELEWIVENGSEHFIDYRHIIKVVKEDIDETKFYGIMLDGNDKYFMLCNGIVSHDSSVD